MKTIHIGHTGTTSLGDIWVAASEQGLVAVQFPSSQPALTAWLEKHHSAHIEVNQPAVEQIVSQLRDYAVGQRTHFDLAIDWSVMREFQRLVLQATNNIPYGQTRTYKEIAIQVGRPRSARAVGRAEATNPMPLVLPCHRVIGADRKLHGYGAGRGLDTKTWLLMLEGAVF